MLQCRSPSSPSSLTRQHPSLLARHHGNWVNDYAPRLRWFRAYRGQHVFCLSSCRLLVSEYFLLLFFFLAEEFLPDARTASVFCCVKTPVNSSALWWYSRTKHAVTMTADRLTSPSNSVLCLTRAMHASRFLSDTGQTTVKKKAPIHYIISINDKVYRPL